MNAIKPLRFLIVVLFGGLVCIQSDRLCAGSLTPEQIKQIKEKLAELRNVLENRASELNANAGDAFLAASQDPKAAVELYLKCHKVVNYDREGRDEREFDDWADGQKNRFKDPQFIESLQVQLRYLALSCKAAETEELSLIIPSLLSYVDGLTRLTEMPGQAVLQSVNGSVFAKAYELENLLEKRQDWEAVPFDIAGIYEKTIFPYLRSDHPEQLMGAWDRRIAQQSQLVAFFEEHESKGNRREERERSERQVRQMQSNGRGGGIIRAHDQDDFERDTLPELKLGKLTDMYLHVDQEQGIAALLAFIEENLNHEKAPDWLETINIVLTSVGNDTPAGPPISNSGLNGSGTTAPAPAGGSPPAAGGSKLPPGLVPAN